ncbi:MAG: VOC family protein [Chitinophagaceae bacterium]|nr:VOC family protein [Chitinophagaceae bacterium]
MQLNSYLTFNGNCREAMLFYKDCLGGRLTLQKAGESPVASQLPDEMKEYILHATLVSGKIMLMASDMVDEPGLVHGNTVSLMLSCDSEEEVRSCYAKLSSGGKATHPLHDTFWGALFGNLVDKFGNQWLLHYNRVEKMN